jgi:hypothetical protein
VQASLQFDALATNKALINQVVAIPYVLVTGETEEMIDDTPTGGGELNLIRVGIHNEMSQNGISSSVIWVSEYLGNVSSLV